MNLFFSFSLLNIQENKTDHGGVPVGGAAAGRRRQDAPAADVVVHHPNQHPALPVDDADGDVHHLLLPEQNYNSI